MTTLLGAMNAQIASANLTALGGTTPRIGRDIAGENAKYPFVTVIDTVSDSNVLMGDRRIWARERRMQWDVWQKYADEDYSLVSALAELLDNMKPVGPFDDLAGVAFVYRTRVIDRHRFYEPQEEIVHYEMDVMVTYPTAHP